jgi:PAS domain S-box-containing protein
MDQAVESPQQHPGAEAAAAHMLAGGGEMGERIRAFDWSQTPLGPIETWPQSLKTAVGIMFASRQPIWLGWGQQLIKLYNDPYKAIVGGKHPTALGQPASVVWREIWDAIGPMLTTAMGGVEGTYVEAQLLIMERNGYPEETYYTFSYSPIPGDEGGAGGIFCANTDDTRRVIGERQLNLLRDLAAKTADARTVADACALSTAALATNPYDLPFAMIYLVEPEARRVVLAGQTGDIEPGHVAAPETAALDGTAIWPFGEVLATNRVCLVSDLHAFDRNLPAGAWDRPPLQAAAMPIAPQGRTGIAGILVVGLNPYRLFDDTYRGFLALVAAQIGAGIANAYAYESERKRAEALAELDRAKTAFFSNVSHEFRTPLTLMLGPLEDTLAQAGDLAAPMRDRLEVAHRNALRLLRLVNTLLDFSRIEAGRAAATYEPTDLAAFTAELASVFRSAIERAGLRLVVDCRPLPEPVYVDRQMWEKIVFNLLSNAFKFTFEGEIAVALRQMGAMAELVVRDTGTGIPADELPHLFERFHRVDGARGRTFEGSGIGLALVQELVKQHGGTVGVESEPDRGSTFVVSIPLGQAHLPADHIHEKPALARPGALSETYIEEALRWLPEPELREQPAGMRDGLLNDELSLASESPRAPSRPAAAASRPLVLLADDNTDMRGYVRRLLSQEYDVVAVGDGAAALRAAQENSVDLVVTDVMMPELDGFELVKALRADERLRTIPVIMLSARAGEEARIEGVEAGADDYLVKPFSVRELLARVRTNLELARIRRESRIEIERQAQLFDTTLSGVGDAIYVFDREKRFQYTNPALQTVWGISRDEYHGKTMADLHYPPDTIEQLEQQLDRVLATGKAVGGVVFYTSPDGKGGYWEYLFSPVIGADGTVELIAGTGRNITERKQAEDALRASQAGLALALQAGKAGTFEWDIQRDVNRWSPELEALYGVTPGTFEGNFQAWANRTEPEDVRMVVASMQAALQAREREYAYEFRAILPDGRRRWLAGRARFDYDDDGAPLRMFGINVDIHERKQAELNAQFLLDLDTQLNRLAELAEIEQAVIDRLGAYLNLTRCYFGHIDGNHVAVHHEWVRGDRSAIGVYRIDDYFSPEAMQQSLATLPTVVVDVTNDSRTAASAVSYQALGIGAFVTVPIVYQDQWVGALNIVNQQPRSWSDDEVQLLREVAARVWPLLEQAQSRAALRASEARLQVLYAQEQAARAQAEEASRLKDEFLATVSHELRTPLTAFLGYAQMLQSRKRDQAYIARALEKMVHSAKNQAQLIEDLLDVSRIVSGKLRVASAGVDLRVVISAALDTVRPAIDAKELRLRVELPPEASVVVGDLNRLQQVMWNLLSNAAKFTAPGGSIVVRLERHDGDAQITVSDTGQGINPEFLPFVFDRFRQAESTSSRTHGGLGLGLSIVRHLVELHGGTVQAFSPGEGQGASFVVRLPLASDARSASHAAAPAMPGSLPGDDICPPDLDGLRVLIVDDQRDILELLAEILTPCGVVARMCDTAQDALETLRAWRPDVLVSDIAMPGKDGYWLIGAVRALAAEEGGAIPAAALTAYVRLEERIRVLSAGFQLYVPKPIEPAELRNVVARLAQMAAGE